MSTTELLLNSYFQDKDTGSRGKTQELALIIQFILAWPQDTEEYKGQMQQLVKEKQRFSLIVATAIPSSIGRNWAMNGVSASNQ